MPLRPEDPTLPPHPLGRFVRSRSGRPPLRVGPPSYRGGSTLKTKTGYVMEYAADHPSYRHTARKMAAQHRLVMEGVLGRLLFPNEVVHHKNRCRDDNSPENLQLLPSRSDHMREHVDEIRGRFLAELTEGQVRAALHGRTTLQAARLLGLNHQTLRNRFPHLLTKRRSPKTPLPADIRALLARLAEDPTVSKRDAAKILGATPETVRQWLILSGLTWTPCPGGRPKHRTRRGPSACPR